MTAGFIKPPTSNFLVCGSVDFFNSVLNDDRTQKKGLTKPSSKLYLFQTWAYIKKNNLQDPVQRQYFTPDAKMAKIFGKSLNPLKVFFSLFV